MENESVQTVSSRSTSGLGVVLSKAVEPGALKFSIKLREVQEQEVLAFFIVAMLAGDTQRTTFKSMTSGSVALSTCSVGATHDARLGTVQCQKV